MTTYSLQYYAAWGVAIVSALTGVIAAVSDPAELGLGPVVYRWIVVFNAFLTVMATMLPSLRRPPASKDDAGPRTNPDPMPRDK